MTGPFDVEPPPPTLFRLEVSVEDTVARLAVFGELDMSTVDALDSRVREVMTTYRPRLLVLDLRETSFMDSMGMRALVMLRRGADAGGYELTVVRGPGAVQRLLEITGLVRELRMVDDPLQALGDVDGRRLA